MFVSPVTFFRFNTNYNPQLRTNSNFEASAVTNPFAASNSFNDVFMRNTNSPSFKSTSAGNALKKLRNITDPYFGVKMISAPEFTKIEQALNNKTTVKQALAYLKKYRPNMQVIERSMYDRFASMSKNRQRVTFPDLLKELYPDALIKLKLEEFKVLDDIDRYSTMLSPKTMLAVREKTTHCRQVILADNPTKPFKRKTVLASLEEIVPQPGEEKRLALLKERANFLPTSNTSENAFIVKYANRGHDEIAERLVRASVQSIEHIHPDSLGGENSLDNFMLASSAANSLRGNMPLPSYIRRFPYIVQNCQRYIDDIIDVIHKGGLKGKETYPYDVAKALKKESHGKIKLDLSKYKYSRQEARKMEENYIAELQKKRLDYMV